MIFIHDVSPRLPRRAASVLALHLALGAFGCHKEATRDQVGPEVRMVETRSEDDAGAGSGESPPGGPDHVVLASASGNVEVTLRDADALRNALLDRLRASTSPDRDELIRATEHASANIDPDGAFRLGVWLLDDGSGDLTLTYRFRQSSAGMVLYVVPVAKKGSTWTAGEVRPQIVHARR